MKYKIYEKTETIEKYKIQKNIFNKKYKVKLYYVNSNYYGVFKTKDKIEIQEYERYLLDQMNKQIIDLLNSQEIDDNIDQKIEKNIETFDYISSKIAIIIPTIFTIIYKNGFNILLYIPLKLINIFMKEIIRNNYIDLSEEDIEKYELFKDNVELLEKYSKYACKNGITANNIDKYSLEQLENTIELLNNLVESKVLKKEMS